MGISEYQWNNRFMGSTQSYGEGSVVLLGAPMDFTVSYRPGSRYGPQKIRETSYGLEEYSPYLDRDLSEVSYYDAGDLELPFGNVEASLAQIGEAAREIFTDGKRPLILGGEHLISLPVLREAHRRFGEDLVLVHWDAHADLREAYLGQAYSHASVMRLSTEFLTPASIYQFGIRSGTREEFDWARKHVRFHPFEVAAPLKKALKEIAGRPIYLSIDIDVLDPAYACGTGTPEPGGITPQEAFEALALLSGETVVGMDVVEVSPVYDHSDRTPILAAKLIREALLAFLGNS